MRVTIEHRESTSGIFRRVTQYEVATTIQFSAEELAVIKKRKLETAVVLQREPNAHRTRHLTHEEKLDLADVFHLKISDLVRGTDVYACDTPLHAKQYEADLKEALQNLKAYIEANSEARSGAQTFEL